MTKDEYAIRELVNTWITASMAGDIPTVLGLMTEDVIFMVPGQPPFGKKEFASAAEKMKSVHFEGKSDIQEIRIMGDWAYLRNHLTMTMTSPDGGAPVSRSGYTLTVLRKDADEQWRLVRDANLMMGEPSFSQE